MKLIAAKCPNCGADINVDTERKSMFCSYCGSQILVDEAINKYQIDIKVGGQISVDGIATEKAKLQRAIMFKSTGQLEQAISCYEELMALNPSNVSYIKATHELYNALIAWYISKSEKQSLMFYVGYILAGKKRSSSWDEKSKKVNDEQENIKRLQQIRDNLTKTLELKNVKNIVRITATELEEEKRKKKDKICTLSIIAGVILFFVAILITIYSIY